MIRSIFFLLVSAFVFTSAASADTRVYGDVEIDAKTGNVVTVALGANSDASTEIASIGEDTQVRGDVNLKVQTRDVITIAGGRNADARTRIGAIGK